MIIIHLTFHPIRAMKVLYIDYHLVEVVVHLLADVSRVVGEDHTVG